MATVLAGYRDSDPSKNAALSEVTVSNSAKRCALSVADSSSEMTQLISYTVGGLPEFIGVAEPGTASSASSWQIKRITYDVSDLPIAIEWAGGVSTFNKVWDDRAGYSYS